MPGGTPTTHRSDECPTGRQVMTGATGSQIPSNVYSGVTTEEHIPSSSEKRRLLAIPHHDVARKRLRGNPHPAMVRSNLPPIATLRDPFAPTNSWGARELPNQVGGVLDRTQHSNSEDGEHPINRKRKRVPSPAGTHSWRPPHLKRQRHKPGTVKVQQSAAQATGTSFDGGQGV